MLETVPVTSPVKSPVTSPVTAPVCVPVLSPVKSPVTSPVTLPVTAPAKAPVNPPAAVTVLALESTITAASLAFTSPVISPVTSPVTAPVKAPSNVLATIVSEPTVHLLVAPSYMNCFITPLTLASRPASVPAVPLLFTRMIGSLVLTVVDSTVVCVP